MPRGRSLLTALVAATLAVSCGFSEGDGSARASAPSGARPAARAKAVRVANVARPEFHPYRVMDRQQGGLVVGTFAVPTGWNATSSVTWSYPECSFPVRLSSRFTSPDG